ncbi:glycosyltransferase involved in cell wall biosynthesis/SAM-dependent methyltransferase [Luteibacter sp. W1I16]
MNMKEQIRTSLAAQYDVHDKLWLPKGQAPEFGYSDGDDTENRIYSIISRADDVSLFSPELKSAQTDWAARYHLSATRANLLRPISDILSGSVLEIGSGCGAISRFLGELGGDVLGVEGSARRAAIAASRCRDLPNVNVINEVFDDFSVDSKFNTVTLIGVLEYASIYGKAEDPARAWLKKAYECLEDGGHLVVAIENQLGLKYLAGMPEDHLAQAMFGVNDLYTKGTATTYGRVELTSMLRDAGFESVEVALPFPDYKLPTSVLLPRACDGSYPEFDASAFARQSVKADAQLIHAPLFSLGQAWGVVGRNELLPDLANSFLLVARKGREPASWATNGPIAHHFATERLAAYCKQISFVPEVGRITVRKALLAGDFHAYESRPISLDLRDEDYIVGSNHADHFERIVAAPGWQIADVVAWFREWQEALHSALREQGEDVPKDLYSSLAGWTIDALPRNLMRMPSGELKFIDLEWRWHAGVEFGYLAYRAITVAMVSVSAVGRPADERHVFIRYVLEDVLRACQMNLSTADLERYVEMDGLLRKLAYGTSDDFSVAQFATFQVPILPDVTSLIMGAADQDRATAARLQSMTEERADFEMKYAEHCREQERVGAELASTKAVLADRLVELERRGQREAQLVQRESDLLNQLASYEERLASLQLANAEVNQKLSAVLSSKSWRLMAPLRVIRRTATNGSARSVAGRGARFLYRRLPLSVGVKRRIKAAVEGVLRPTMRAGSADVPHVQTDAWGNSQIASTVVPFNDYVDIATTPMVSDEIDVRLIAFYLPQFHPIPENDRWWGRGFTEWTNVAKAKPQYPGHHQPQLPGELGFYDLRIVDVMARQVELAKLYGIAGFCFHYYWFGGKRLLERPINQFVQSDIQFPFCICWANENWTRRWDGLDGEVLIGQSHSPEDDLAFIEALAPLVRDPRYIRVNGKPLVIVYRPSVLPDAAATLERWRTYCRDAGVGEIFMAMVQFDVDDPRIYGFDAAIEFPPHKLARNLEAINHLVEGLNPDFSGAVVDYQAIVDRASQVRNEGFNLIRGVFPSWDNEARKPGRGYMFHGATPERYRGWLRQSLEFARSNPIEGERMVFVNAWNEWAEGAHLEPDARFGYSFLAATREALLERSGTGDAGHGYSFLSTTRGACSKRSDAERIVIVSHDAHPHGAQYLSLHIARDLSEVFGLQVDIVVLGDGPLLSKFREVADVHVLSGVSQNGAEALELAERLAATSRHAIVNSAASGLFSGVLSAAGFGVASLVHELPGVISEYELQEHARTMAKSSRRLLFPSTIVRDGFANFASLSETSVEIRPQGTFTRNRWRGVSDRSTPRSTLRNKLGLPTDAEVVLAVGYADLRKGVDLLVRAGLEILGRGRDTHFVWVGHVCESIVAELSTEIKDRGFEKNFHFVGMDFETADYYAGADVYALASREDPFPSVVLEALSVGLPVVAFSGAGGASDILTRGCGVMVNDVSPGALASGIIELLDDRDLRAEMGRIGQDLVEKEFSFRHYLFALLDAVGLPQAKVSVIVPNYNYAHLLGDRLRSIDAQTVPVYELIVLDDHSTDDSLAVLTELRSILRTDFSLVENAVNSGSVFKQWEKGVGLARGDLIWIAEADDSSEPSFLEKVLSPLQKYPDVVFSYAQSKQIGDSGQLLADNYLAYTDDVDSVLWRGDYIRAGEDEIHNALAIKNTIPNVSAVVFRAPQLRDVLREAAPVIQSFRIAGDWVAYILLAAKGQVAYIAEPLNQHRRHSSSVTIGSRHMPHLLEVLRVQQLARQVSVVPDEVAVRAWSYSERLFVQLGLATPEVPSLDRLKEAAGYRP